MNPAGAPPPAASFPWQLPPGVSPAAGNIASAVDAVCGIVCTDRAGLITWVNSGFERMTGHTRAEVLQQSPGSFLQGPETSPTTVAHMRAAIASGKGFSVEVLNYTRAGAHLWVSIECHPELDSKGALVGFTAIQTDITARKNAEARVDVDRQRLDAIVAAAPGVVYEFCRSPLGEYRFTYVSAKILEVFGVTVAEALRDSGTLFSRIESEDVVPFQASIERSAADLSPWRELFRIQHPQFGRRWLEAQSSPRRLPDGTTAWSGILWDVTPAEQARQQQRELTGRLQLALHGTAFGVWEFEFATGRLRWDARMNQLHGLAPGEFRETIEHWQSFIVPQDLARVQAAFAHVLESETPLFDVAFRIRRSDGEVRFIEGNGILERDAEGRPLRAVGMNRDATARHRADQELRDTLREREELKSALEQHAKVVVLNRRARVVQVNDRFCRTSGFAREELIGGDFRLLDAGQHPTLFRALWRQISRGEPWRGDVALRAKSGAIFWVTATIQPLLDDRGRPRHYIVIGSDITHRVQSFRELKRLSERLRTALITARMVWWEANLVTQTLHIDSADAPCILGFEERRIANLTVHDWKAMIHPEDLPEVERTLEAALAGRTEDWRCSYRLLSAAGDYQWLADIGRITARDATGKPTLLEGTTQDVNAERVTLERHRQLEAQLWEAQRLETVGNFASGITHDFNNLLSGIRGSVQLAQLEYEGTTPLPDSLNAALKGCDRARDLVKRILLFARGGGEASRATIDLPRLLAETRPLIEAAVTRGVLVRIRVVNPVPPVSADESQLVQVVMNLAINAAQAMEEKGGILEIVARHRRIETDTVAPNSCAPGDYAVLEVSDQGCGMPAAVVARIFEPFFTTKSRDKGSGLGLSVVQRILKDHGGTISVHSVEGQGSTFEAWLPATSPAPADQPEPPAMPAGRAPIPHRRIMVVDDEPLVRDVLLAALKLSRHQGVGFDDPVQALGWLEREATPIDLVVTDFSMPTMDGLEFSRRVRALRPGIPVLVISGNFGAAPQALRDLENSRTLDKPIQLADFEAAVNQLLGS